MSIRYDTLLQLLKTRGYTKTTLAKRLGISSRTLAKLSSNDYVSLKVIENICLLLNCTPSEILYFVKDFTESPLLKTLKEEKNMRYKGGVYHFTHILLTYNSNHIEGSKLSEDQTRYIFETNTIGIEPETAVQVDDVIETVNHFKCIDFLIDCAHEELTEALIKKLHAMLKTGTSDSRKEWFAIGDYKKKPNVVGGQITVAPSNVAFAVKKLLNWYGAKSAVTFDDIVDFHSQFEHIHPFQDGNGRVGRLIAFKECLKYCCTPFYIDEDLKLFYYRGLKEWKTERGYLIDTCKAGQDKFQAHTALFDTDTFRP